MVHLLLIDYVWIGNWDSIFLEIYATAFMFFVNRNPFPVLAENVSKSITSLLVKVLAWFDAIH
jgi:hypothetical protein